MLEYQALYQNSVVPLMNKKIVLETEKFSILLERLGITFGSIDEETVELCTTNPCDANANCTNTVGSYVCFCHSGFTGNGINCSDTDECAISANDCSPNANCANTVGSFTCQCKAGYTGNGTSCTDINECILGNDNCHANATCSDTIGSFACQCNIGFEGNGSSCKDINECDSGLHNCHLNASCFNNLGSFSCACKTGYVGNGTKCEDYDECTYGLNNCDNRIATCTNTPGLFQCKCKAGFHGDGINCTDINECETDNCHANATCTNSIGSFTCQCNTGFDGDGLSCTDINDCVLETDNCHANATCTDTIGSFTCQCNTGFEGNGLNCTDINECALETDHCHANATCTDTIGSFTCQCNTGFEGNGLNCTDINECVLETDNCHANATCTDTIGSFTCQCNTGFEGNGLNCTDINECVLETDNCHANATCTDTIGSFTCQCNTGFEGNGLNCTDIDECATKGHTCSKDGICYNNIGSYTCRCHVGFSGDGKKCTGPCPSETVGTVDSYGIFSWPETPVGTRSSLACPYNNESFAIRECLYTNKTNSGNAWGPTVATDCNFQDVRSKDLFLLAQEDVNINNLVNISRDVRNLSSVNPTDSTLKSGDISNIATVLEKIVAVKVKSNEISDDFLTTVDNILDNRVEDIFESQQKKNTSSRIVQSLNNFAESLIISYDRTFQKVKRNYALNLQAIQQRNFSGITFSGIVRKEEAFLENNSISIVYNAYAIERLNSFVIAGSIKGLSVANLQTPVKIAFEKVSRGDTNSTLCSYWDFSIGNWSHEGCSFQRILDDNRILCHCNHFTNFAMLMDINPRADATTIHYRILGVTSSIGCALSLAGLLLTIVTMLLSREQRKQLPSQILLNFCIALSLMIMVLLVSDNMLKKSTFTACRAAAIALHYFFLSAFLWMAVEGFTMYLKIIKIFSASSNSKFLLKCCLFAWGIPALIVVITILAAIDKYGDTNYCRLQGIPFIVAFLAPAVIIFVGNIIFFAFIIHSLRTSGNNITSTRKRSGYQQARQGIAITVLLGLTWLFGILAIGDAKLPIQYLFCIFNSLQGWFVFIFFVLIPARKEQLRKRRQKNNNVHLQGFKLRAAAEGNHQNGHTNNAITDTHTT
ncbi:adhesion G protein-coupled receptor E1-like [Dendronephthya gigantea]|uniref:adhesion G protein-coupled receptor E1-like n=1 Tax=Dendronephthya gigantea TaxID=151771 RepID=UPI00106C30BF|nr:adhesion G protein-coupled receptor E1-like [Dendronephthya gigantea]